MTNTLSTLIGSRICHDLISPIGAIGNGLELLSMSMDASGPEFALIEDSVKNANARIRFFRIAFGDAREGQKIGRDEVLAVLTGLTHGGRFAYVWEPDGDLDRLDVRIIFLILQCFETAMPYGGEIEVHHDAISWQIRGRGRQVVVDQRLWDGIVQGHSDSLSASQVQFALLHDILDGAQRDLKLEHSDTELVVRF